MNEHHKSGDLMVRARGTPQPPYYFDKKYPHNKLIRDGAVLVYYRPKGHPGYFVLLIHEPCANGDGGVVWEFSRRKRKWVCDGMGRLRYCHPPARDVFKNLIDSLPPSQTWPDKPGIQL